MHFVVSSMRMILDLIIMYSKAIGPHSTRDNNYKWGQITNAGYEAGVLLTVGRSYVENDVTH